jgi:hypothetical protein
MLESEHVAFAVKCDERKEVPPPPVKIPVPIYPEEGEGYGGMPDSAVIIEKKGGGMVAPPVIESEPEGELSAVVRLRPAVPRMIPGNWGKAESGWLARPLRSCIARCGDEGRIHQFLWRRSRAVSNAS